MKLNHMICPNCDHDFYVSTAYATCDACNCTFYACQSKTCKPRPPVITLEPVTILWPNVTVSVWPNVVAGPSSWYTGQDFVTAMKAQGATLVSG